MGRSRRNKKIFPCMHRGFGQYCHRCADATSLEVKYGSNMTKEQREEIEQLKRSTLPETAANRRKSSYYEQENNGDK